MTTKQIIRNELKKNFTKLPDFEPYETLVNFDEGANLLPVRMWVAYKFDDIIIAFEPNEKYWHVLESDSQHLVIGGKNFVDAYNAV